MTLTTPSHSSEGDTVKQSPFKWDKQYNMPPNQLGPFTTALLVAGHHPLAYLGIVSHRSHPLQHILQQPNNVHLHPQCRAHWWVSYMILDSSKNGSIHSLHMRTAAAVMPACQH